MKICTKCKTKKDASEFYRRGDSDSGLRSACISCHMEARRKACKSCGQSFLPEGSHADRCPNCYPFYRQAQTLYHASKHRAGKKGLSFDLDSEWIEAQLRKPCPKTGVGFAILADSSGYGDRGPFGPSLDKINPDGGYTKDNVQVVCWWYNVSKQRFSDSEVLELCKLVVKTASS